MDEKKLLLFLHKILANGSKEKAEASIRQIYNLLSTQNTDKRVLDIIEKALNSIPEAAEVAAKQESLTREDLEIAANRAQKRIEREMEMSRYGRC